MGLFKDEKATIVRATNTAKDGIDLALVVSCAAILIACAAIVVAVRSNHG